MFVVTYRKIFFALSGLFVAFSIGAVAFLGLPLGIDFTGGSILEVSYDEARPEKAVLENRLNQLDIGSYSLLKTGETGYLLRMRETTENELPSILNTLEVEGSTPTQERFSSIGPTIGQELRTKALIAIFTVVLVIILYVAFAFRKVSEPVSSWKYGLIAILALLHDIIIPTGVFAVLAYLTGAEVDILFVMALLAILGYSVNDTIVVFDRVRENLRLNKENKKKEDFVITVGRSLDQTLTRSINTSLTTALVLIALFFIGPPSTRDFAIVLLAGVVAGSYSSIALAAPLLASLERWGKRG
ncbi:MAG: protein translocase subunit SecF [Candidatus Paceibacterota bacterium]